MMSLITLVDAGGTSAYQILVAIVIVLLSGVVLTFLYRNVARELKTWKKEKDVVDGKEENTEAAKSSRKFSSMENLLNSIDKKISTSIEGDLAVMYLINIDDFRSIAETYELKIVERVIVEIEKRLRKKTKKGDISGHLKDDEFIFYYSGEVNNDIINQIGDDILDAVRAPLKTIVEHLTASVGVVIFPYDGSNSENLYRNAELALYVAKKEGKNRIHLYSEELLEKEQFNITYYQEIKRSIENDEFILYYQPIVDLKTGKIIGFESLLRWNHPTMGVLSPGKFLNVMDLSGDITWFGTWGFEKIVKQYKNWREKIKFRDLYISTNLSPKQLVIEGLAHQFFNITKKYEMSPELFCMEIIDYYNIINDPIAIHNLNEFRKFGFRIAVDDMGNEYQIIDDLPNIQAGIFKINRSNLQLIVDEDAASDKILRSIDVAKQLQKIVIVEGIENADMISAMVKWDIRFMQGYYFSEPVNTEMAEEMLKHSPWNMASFNNFFQKPE